MTTTCCRACSDCTKQILESKFQLAAKVWCVMATSLPCSIKPAAPELRKSAIKFARPKVGPLLLPALLGLLRLLPHHTNFQCRGALSGGPRLLVRGDQFCFSIQPSSRQRSGQIPLVQKSDRNQ